MKIPKYILKKLKKIEEHQRAVKTLLDEIETWQPELKSRYDNDNRWNFAMFVDQQGEICNEENSVSLLVEFLNMKDEET
jgi:hypothetical protein